jgi:hypothetical protein
VQGSGADFVPASRAGCISGGGARIEHHGSGDSGATEFTTTCTVIPGSTRCLISLAGRGRYISAATSGRTLALKMVTSLSFLPERVIKGWLPARMFRTWVRIRLLGKYDDYTIAGEDRERALKTFPRKYDRAKIRFLEPMVRCYSLEVRAVETSRCKSALSASTSWSVGADPDDMEEFWPGASKVFAGS